MADFDDFADDRGSGPQFLPPERSGPPLFPIVGGAALLLLLGGVWYVYRATRPVAPSAPQTTADLPRPPARRAAEPGEAIDLPPLDQSDTLLRTLVGRLSSHPAVAAWLTTDGLIRNFTVVVVNVADGDTPSKHLKPLRPAGAFSTKTSGGLTWVDPASYRRYDGVAAAVDSLDARGVARLYATVKPRIDDAYHELAGPDANFDRTLERAIVALLRTPVVDRDIQLNTEKVSYRYANPSLEELSKAQRQFLRMGPRNMRIVKAKVRAIAGFLGIPDALLPPPDGETPR